MAICLECDCRMLVVGCNMRTDVLIHANLPGNISVNSKTKLNTSSVSQYDVRQWYDTVFHTCRCKHYNLLHMQNLGLRMCVFGF